MSTTSDSTALSSISATSATTDAVNRRSYRCYHCNYSFHITPVPTTATSSPSSFRCPQCHYRHLIPHHVVSPPPPPLPNPPPPSPPALLTYDPHPYFYTSDDFESDYDYDSDNSLLSFTTPSTHLSTPTLKSFVDSLPIKKITKFSAPLHQSCSICMECFEIENNSGTSVIVNELPCQHYFHKDCIVEWLNRTNTCPLCRFKLPFEPGSDDRRSDPDPAQDEWEEEYGAVLVVNLAVPVAWRVTEESDMGSNSGSGRQVVREADAEDRRERNGWDFDAMRDEDGDTLMVDA